MATEELKYNAQGSQTARRVVWTLTDQQGTVRDFVLRNADGSLTQEHLKYDVFGTPDDSSQFDELGAPIDGTGPVLSTAVRARFAGQQFRLETGAQLVFGVGTCQYLARPCFEFAQLRGGCLRTAAGRR